MTFNILHSLIALVVIGWIATLVTLIDLASYDSYNHPPSYSYLITKVWILFLSSTILTVVLAGML